MKYIIWCFAFGSGLIALTILGEYISNKLPETNKFRKWWNNNVIGKAPHNKDF